MCEVLEFDSKGLFNSQSPLGNGRQHRLLTESFDRDRMKFPFARVGNAWASCEVSSADSLSADQTRLKLAFLSYANQTFASQMKAYEAGSPKTRGQSPITIKSTK